MITPALTPPCGGTQTAYETGRFRLSPARDPDRHAARPAAVLARLLLAQGDRTRDLHVRDLAGLLGPGDLLVLNDAGDSGAAVSARARQTRRARPSPASKSPCWSPWRTAGRRWQSPAQAEAGQVIRFGDTLSAEVVSISDAGLVLRFDASGRRLRRGAGAGRRHALPPISPRCAPDEADRQDYQTVWARRSGAVAAPTASLHFDDDLLQAAGRKGVRPCHAACRRRHLPARQGRDVTTHKMHGRWGEVTAEAADAISSPRAAGGRVIPVGTTALRG